MLPVLQALTDIRASAEAELAQNAGALSVSLGRRILRAETAAIAAGAVVMYVLGEMKR